MTLFEILSELHRKIELNNKISSACTTASYLSIFSVLLLSLNPNNNVLVLWIISIGLIVAACIIDYLITKKNNKLRDDAYQAELNEIEKMQENAADKDMKVIVPEVQEPIKEKFGVLSYAVALALDLIFGIVYKLIQ